MVTSMVSPSMTRTSVASSGWRDGMQAAGEPLDGPGLPAVAGGAAAAALVGLGDCVGVAVAVGVPLGVPVAVGVREDFGVRVGVGAEISLSGDACCLRSPPAAEPIAPISSRPTITPMMTCALVPRPRYQRHVRIAATADHRAPARAAATEALPVALIADRITPLESITLSELSVIADSSESGQLRGDDFLSRLQRDTWRRHVTWHGHGRLPVC
jgi:hypothetical protein